MKFLKSWIQENILSYTAVVGLFVYFVGPFLQSTSTNFLQKIFSSKPINISICTPIKNVTRTITSHDGQREKIHSAHSAPFMQRVTVTVTNQSGGPINGSKLFVFPVNYADNQIAYANFVTDNNIEGKKIGVIKSDDNKFNLDIGNFYNGQTIALKFLTLFPTNFFVEFGSENINQTEISDAGNCMNSNITEFSSAPLDFYNLDLFDKGFDTKFGGKIDDIIGPIGPLSFTYLFEFNCGGGIERLAVPMNGSFSMCGMQYNKPEEPLKSE